MKAKDKRTRVLAILQLCLVFTLMAWCMGYPFMGELFSYRARILSYQDVMGVVKNGMEEQKVERLDRNAERFKALPLEKRTLIKERYEELQELSEKPFWKKMMMAIRILFYELPLFELAWIVLSLIVSVLLLMRVEGAWQAVWLLPVLVLCYAWENQTRGLKPVETAEYKLYPSEELIIADYLDETWSSNIFEQQRQLKGGWENYVVVNWAKEVPSRNVEIFKQQVEAGEFAFHMTRLEAMQYDPEHQMAYFFRKKNSLALLCAYFLWNVYFAFSCSNMRTGLRKYASEIAFKNQI